MLGTKHSGMMTTLWFLSLLVRMSMAKGYKCNSGYKNISATHSICKSPIKGCQILNQGVSREDIGKILGAHNTFRQKVASGELVNFPTAADMTAMAWDEELAAIAQAHADTCIRSHDCYQCRRVGRFSVGQNMFFRLGKQEATFGKDTLGWTGVVHAWTKDKEKHISAEDIGSFHSNMAGDLTQAIWAQTTYVGCGRTKFHMKGQDTIYTTFVCNYGPAGNVVGSPVYRTGEPCSQCPNNTVCSSTFPALCIRFEDLERTGQGLPGYSRTTQKLESSSGEATEPVEEETIETSEIASRHALTDHSSDEESGNANQSGEVTNRSMPIIAKTCKCKPELLDVAKAWLLQKMLPEEGSGPEISITCQCLQSQ